MNENCEHVNELIGCCGLDCEKCDARIATLTNDNTLREKNRRPVDKAQRRADRAGNAELYRLPHGGRKNAVLRQALFCTQLRAGKGIGYLCGLRADGRLLDVGAHQRP